MALARCLFRAPAMVDTAVRWLSTHSADGTGVVVGFGRQGWPLVRLGEQQLGPVDPGDVIVMRGQTLRLDQQEGQWRILEVLEGPRKKKCIHPTRVAGLCKSCPRRKGKQIR